MVDPTAAVKAEIDEKERMTAAMVMGQEPTPTYTNQQLVHREQVAKDANFLDNFTKGE